MTTTWAGVAGRNRSVTATCTTGSESAPSAPAKAAQTVAFASAVAGNTVTIRALTFTAIANGATPATVLEFSVGASNTACGDNFAAAVNANQNRLAITASNNAGTVTLTATDYGTVQNAWSLTKVGAPITLGGATLAGGVDYFGVNLDGVGAINVQARAAAGQTITGGVLKCYYWDPDTGVVASCTDLDLSVTAAALRSYAFAGPSPGIGIPVVGMRGFLGWVPSGVTISSGSMIVDHLAAAAELTDLGRVI